MILKTYAHVHEDAENSKVAARVDIYHEGDRVIPSANSADVILVSDANTTAPMPAVLHVQLNGRMVALPVLGTILVVAGECTIDTQGHAT